MNRVDVVVTVTYAKYIYEDAICVVCGVYADDGHTHVLLSSSSSSHSVAFAELCRIFCKNNDSVKV